MDDQSLTFEIPSTPLDNYQGRLWPLPRMQKPVLRFWLRDLHAPDAEPLFPRLRAGFYATRIWRER